jgi:AcrR family transcriptional regulator
MTQEEIIRAALKVWGRDLYRTNSLTQVAQELKVSKPALYRYFRDKDALLNGMYEYFFDEFTTFIRRDYERALATDSHLERALIMIRKSSEYFLLHSDFFVFCMIIAFSNREKRDITQAFLKRGIDLSRLSGVKNAFCRDWKSAAEGGGGYPSISQLLTNTLVLWVALYLSHGYLKEGKMLTSADVRPLVDSIELKVLRGIGNDRAPLREADFARLEEAIHAISYEESEENRILKAAADTIAENGPWNTSMEMIAQRSGISKSGLYSHFKSKEEMIGRLFLTEFSRIIRYGELGVINSKLPAEQLYLAIISIVAYLKARPEILTMLDWVRFERPHSLGVKIPRDIYSVFTEIDIPALHDDGADGDNNGRWILFMIVNVLMVWKSGKTHLTTDFDLSRIPDESFRKLYKFINSGLSGLEEGVSQ